jgi:hypothetical protein
VSRGAIRLAVAALGACWPLLAAAQGLPRHEGACATTTIARLEHRLRSGTDGAFVQDSGSAVVFANGGYQVSYEELEAIHDARTGDKVLICLVRIPHGCPAGDPRGRWYTTTDLRTMESWTLPDAEHGCGGA